MASEGEGRNGDSARDDSGILKLLFVSRNPRDLRPESSSVVSDLYVLHSQWG